MENNRPPVTANSNQPSADNSLAVVMQLLGFAGFIFPFGNILGPLILWLIKRAESPYLDRIGKEAINFQISYSIYGIVAGLLCFVLVGFLLFPILFIAWIVLMVIAAVKTSNGEEYRYPFTIRLLQ